jgi:hypothetical protein
MRFIEQRESAELGRRYERVMGLLAKAEADGFDVSILRRKAAVAMKLDDSRHRRQAVLMLAEVELHIPYKKEQYIPMYPPEEEVVIPPDVPGRRVRKGGR